MSEMENKTNKSAVNIRAGLVCLLLPVFLVSLFGTMLNMGSRGNDVWFTIFLLCLVGSAAVMFRMMRSMRSFIDPSVVAAAREMQAGRAGQPATGRGYVDPSVSQDTSNPAVMAQKMYQSGSMSASAARGVGANVASGVRDRRD